MKLNFGAYCQIVLQNVTPVGRSWGCPFPRGTYWKLPGFSIVVSLVGEKMLFHRWFYLHFFNYQCSQTSFHMVIICLYLFSEQTVHILVFFFPPTGPEINFKVFREIKSRIQISNILFLPLILFPFVLRWQIAGRAGGLGIFILCCLSREPSVTSQKGLSVPTPSRTRQLII